MEEITVYLFEDSRQFAGLMLLQCHQNKCSLEYLRNKKIELFTANRTLDNRSRFDLDIAGSRIDKSIIRSFLFFSVVLQLIHSNILDSRIINFICKSALRYSLSERVRQ